MLLDETLATVNVLCRFKVYPLLIYVISNVEFFDKIGMELSAEMPEIDMSALEIVDSDQKIVDQLTPSSLHSTEKASSVAHKTRKSGRIKIRPLAEVEKRRVITRPRKVNNQSKLESIYLDKKVKLFYSSLETIFEEPKNNITIGGRKLKRTIQFSEYLSAKPDRSKVRKRKLRIQKFFKQGFKAKANNLGLDTLMNKLGEMEKEDSSLQS